ncbi:MAG: hypothetical protein RIA69_10780 [Cyclobacteriaceae bacterium]
MNPKPPVESIYSDIKLQFLNFNGNHGFGNTYFNELGVEYTIEGN